MPPEALRAQAEPFSAVLRTFHEKKGWETVALVHSAKWPALIPHPTCGASYPCAVCRLRSCPSCHSKMAKFMSLLATGGRVVVAAI
jgi:hypothetical protein